MSYEKRGRLVSKIDNIEQYHPIFEKDNFQISESHWRMISKNTITLFQVLIDQDLIDLVSVLEAYPKYTKWVCDHFRYAYSYSENEADIDAASKLLSMGESYFSKQFVRNVIRKLPKLDEKNLKELNEFSLEIQQNHKSWHPIIVNYYCETIVERIDQLKVHPLQAVILKKPIESIEREETYEYDSKDRDAVLDIPYMN